MSSIEEEASLERETIIVDDKKGDVTATEDSATDTSGPDNSEPDSDKDATTEKQDKNGDISEVNVDDKEHDTDVSDKQRDKDVSDGEKDINGKDGETNTTQGQMDQASEKSLISDADSSAFAEAVVKTVISKAVDAVKASAMDDKFEKDTARVESEIDKPESEKPEPIKTEAQAQPDVKVGLFQYQGFGDGDSGEDSDESDEEVEEKVDAIKTVSEQDSQVGLFQYTNMEESELPKSLEVSDEEDNDNETLESLTDDDKTNIMQLYGLSNVAAKSPVSPKSASPSENEATVSEDKGQVMVIDVQRQVYEPQARSFHVQKENISPDSTPRETNDVELEIKGETALPPVSDSGGVNDDTAFSDIDKDSTETETDANATDNQSVKDNEEHTSDVSPPLIQYQSVTENGKFRIIKTSSKEGLGIRVGSPKESPKQSPRELSENESVKSESDKTDQESVKSRNSPREDRNNAIDDITADIKESPVNQTSDKAALEGEQQNLGKPFSDRDDVEQSQELDMDRIKALLEMENNQRTAQETRQEFESDNDRRYTDQMHVSELRTTAKPEMGERSEVVVGDRSDISVDSYDWTARRSVEGSYGAEDDLSRSDRKFPELYQPRRRVDQDRYVLYINFIYFYLTSINICIIYLVIMTF